MSKRQRPDEPSQDIEQRLTNLIVKIGDKNVANLTTHIEGLANALKGDLPSHRELIMDEIEELKAKSSEFLKRLNKGRKEKRCGPHAAAAAACCSPALRFPGRALLTRADGSQTTGEV